GLTDDGKELSEQEVHFLLSLPASSGIAQNRDDARLVDLLNHARDEARFSIESRNMELFQQESDKLDCWAEDQRRAQKGRLEELDAAAKDIRKRAREAASLPEKLALQQELRSLDRQRNDAWRDFDGKTREIEDERDRIEADAARMLESTQAETDLFTVSWTLT
ncbi:MAG: hypothetical protein KDN05_22390, partial [Verrucomicrobiae bacterium]|nr:hypothetical protein [Verrucomicrobiae bacterium]